MNLDRQKVKSIVRRLQKISERTEDPEAFMLQAGPIMDAADLTEEETGAVIAEFSAPIRRQAVALGLVGH